MLACHAVRLMICVHRRVQYHLSHGSRGSPVLIWKGFPADSHALGAGYVKVVFFPSICSLSCVYCIPAELRALGADSGYADDEERAGVLAALAHLTQARPRQVMMMMMMMMMVMVVVVVVAMMMMMMRTTPCLRHGGGGGDDDDMTTRSELEYWPPSPTSPRRDPGR
jgi:hypothetical protein